MKNTFKKILLLSFVSFLIYSCTKEERFEGTPALNGQDVETIYGSIVSNTLFALPGQLIDCTVTLPSEFVARVDQEVSVEVQTLSTTNSLRKATVIVPKGQTTASGKVIVGGGGGTFFMPVVLKLSAVKLTTELPGKHFLLTSDDVIVNSGSTSVPTDDEKRMQIKIAWDSHSTGNVMDCKISRVGSVAVTLKGTLVGSVSNIKINGTPYNFTYLTTLDAAASNFATTYKTSIMNANPGIFEDIYSFGKAIIFKYVTPLPPVLPTFQMGTASPATTGIVGNNFTSNALAVDGTNTFNPRIYPILNSQLTSASGVEGQSAYNEGTYQIAIQPSTILANLESNPIDLKYRIVIKMPDTSVKIFEGVYTNATPTSGYKNVLKFDKTGYGAAATYTNFIFTP